MIFLARSRRPQGRFMIISAIASLFLLLLLLHRTPDTGLVNTTLTPGLLITSTKQITSDIHSSHSLTQGSDEHLSEYEFLEYSPDEDDDLKPYPISRPFSLSLPPAPSSLSTPSPSAIVSHRTKLTEPIETTTANFPLTPPGDRFNISQNTRVSGKPTNMTISGFVFYGRRDRVESMHCYLERNLVTHGGWLDEVIWVVNTKDVADLAYLDNILARSPLYRTHILPELVTGPGFAKIWRLVDRETMYIKIDDDIVWFADDAIELLVKRKLQRRDALVVSANIINEPPLSFLHYHMGALHPYFPDLPKDFDYNQLVQQPPKPSIISLR